MEIWINSSTNLVIRLAYIFVTATPLSSPCCNLLCIQLWENLFIDGSGVNLTKWVTEFHIFVTTIFCKFIIIVLCKLKSLKDRTDLNVVCGCKNLEYSHLIMQSVYYKLRQSWQQFNWTHHVKVLTATDNIQISPVLEWNMYWRCRSSWK